MLAKYSFLLIIFILIIGCSSDKKIVYSGGQKFYVENLQSLPMDVSIFSNFLNDKNGLQLHLDSILQMNHKMTSSDFQNDNLFNFLHANWKPGDSIFETRTESNIKFTIQIFLQVDLSTLEYVKVLDDNFFYNADIITILQIGSVDFTKLIPVNNHISQKYYYRSEGQIKSNIEIKKENYIID